jgi:hypothetical protein
MLPLPQEEEEVYNGLPETPPATTATLPSQTLHDMRMKHIEERCNDSWEMEPSIKKQPLSVQGGA